MLNAITVNHINRQSNTVIYHTWILFHRICVLLCSVLLFLFVLCRFCLVSGWKFYISCKFSANRSETKAEAHVKCQQFYLNRTTLPKATRFYLHFVLSNGNHKLTLSNKTFLRLSAHTRSQQQIYKCEPIKPSNAPNVSNKKHSPIILCRSLFLFLSPFIFINCKENATEIHLFVRSRTRTLAY